MNGELTYSYLKACEELQTACMRFDWLRAYKLLQYCDELFEGRENYSFEVKFWKTEKPGLAITYGDVTLFFKCYRM